MLLSLNIISELADIQDLSLEDIANRLVMSTAEIENIEYINQHLKTVITARIENVQPHPNADKLTLVDLDTGKDKVRVVCGAPNHKKGDIVPLALPGTKFTEEFTVKETKIRGEKSAGMLCSEKELGFSDDHSGLMILPSNIQPGIKLSDIYKDWTDIRFEIENKTITHRPDLWGHVGFAREIAAIFGRKLKYNINYDIEKTFKHTDDLIVTIKNPTACYRYCGLVVKNITVKESPDWLKAKVTAIGMRPISNIVDVTNYIMSELGEPMHAFDRKKLKGNEIIVRMAEQGEQFKTLDSQEHVLISDDIVIADKGGAIALAGVMGGAYSEIDDSTTEIVLEAANFNPVMIRRTAGRFNLRTEAAIRFEKSLDPELCSAAIIRCYELIKQLIPEAEATTAIVDAYPAKPKKVTITTTTDFIRKKVGDDITDSRIIEILNSLNFKVNASGKELSIEVPSFRATGDVSIPDDIVEEVGRIFGYDNIRSKAPLVPCAPPERNEKRLFERKIKNILVKDHHLIEVSNYSFVGEESLNRTGINENKELRLKNPISIEQDRLRRNLIPNILSNIELNRRYFDSFRIFELGRVYLKEDRTTKELASENTRISGALYSKESDVPEFYNAKNIITDLLEQLYINKIKYEPAKKDLPPFAHPARSLSITIAGKNAGIICEIHPRVTEKFGIKGNTALFDLDMDLLLTTEKAGNDFIELQKYPDVPFEISVIAGKQQYVADISAIIGKSNKEFIKSIDVISVYEGDPIPADSKSVSFKIVFAAKDATLSPEQIDKLQKKVIEALNKSGFKLR